MLKVAAFLVVGYFGLTHCQDWSDSYMEAYRESHRGEHHKAKEDEFFDMSQFDFQLATIKPIFTVVSAIAKILLKVAVFKIIVKFAAIVCLLFFIPWVKLPEMVHNEMPETRSLKQIYFDELIDNQTKKFER